MIGLNLTSFAVCLLAGFGTGIGWHVGRWVVGRVLK